MSNHECTIIILINISILNLDPRRLVNISKESIICYTDSISS